jgi:hypothetical protein
MDLEIINNLKTQIIEFNIKYIDLQKQVISLSEQVEILNETKNTISREFICKCEELDNLKNKNKILEDDIKQLTKVSHVIAIERNNSILNLENIKLKNEMQKLLNKNIEFLEKSQEEPLELQEEPLELQEELIESQELELYEKVIKGNVYYISCKDDMNIFIKNEDNSVGNNIGRIIKINGKSKIDWFNDK